MRPRTGSIIKRGNVYWLRYQLNGKRVQESLELSTMRAAQTEAEKRMAPIRSADKATALRAIHTRLQDAETVAAVEYDKANPPLRLNAVWTQFLHSDAVPAGKGTLGQYEGQWSQFHKWLKNQHAAAEFLRDVSPEIAVAYIHHLTERGLSGQRINQHLVFLRGLCRELAKPARITANPFEDIKRRKQAGNSKRMLTVEEIKRIIESATGELRTLFMLGAFLGLRLGDCATLLWSEVDLARKIVARIPRKIAYKGKKGEVLIGIPATLHPYLSALSRSGKYVVPECAAQYERDPTILTNRIKAHLEACKIETVQEGTGKGTDKRAVVLVGFHSLRHSYISIMAQAGASVAVLQKLAGHSSPAMTAHYTHITEQAALDTAAKMPALLGDGKKRNAIQEPLPMWAVTKLRKMTSTNWTKVRDGLLKGLE